MPQSAARLSGGIAVALVLVLSVAGATPSAAAPPVGAAPGQPAPPATVQVYGRAGTFGELPTALQLASGQTFATNAVPGWGFPNGREFWANTRTSDGTVIVAGGDQNANQVFQSSPEAVVGAFDTNTGAFSTTKLTTTRIQGGSPVPGPTTVPTPGLVAVPPGTNGRGGTSVSDVEAFNGGNAVAFVAWRTHLDHDVDQHGIWPVFGILTKVGGQWKVASGSGWMNQWTGGQLRVIGSADALRACPEEIYQSPTAVYPGQSDCRALTEIAALPSTGIPNTYDFIATQYGDDASTPDHSGGILALRVTGPDAAGRYTTTVRDQFDYPTIPDPTTPSTTDTIGISPLSVMVDPSGSVSDRRFAVNFDHWQALDPPRPAQPSVFQEFSYNGTTGTITPASRPILPGDMQANGAPYAMKHVVYGHDGTLYATRFGDNWAGGRLAVYPKVGGQRRLTSDPACAYDPAVPMGSYTTPVDLPAPATDYTVWGDPCRPNYDIVQPRDLPWAIPIENPTTHDIFVVSDIGGSVVPIRPSGSGTSMSFQVGNLVDIGKDLLPRHSGSPPRTSSLMMSVGSFDAANRLWLSVGEGRSDHPCGDVPLPRYPFDDGHPYCMQPAELPAEQWLVSIDADDLFTRPVIALSGETGGVVASHAEATRTISTRTTAGSSPSADVQVLSHAHVVPCGGSCTTDFQPGNGFYLRDPSNPFGFFGSVQYQISVPSEGDYQLGYFVDTWHQPQFSTAAIQAQVGSASVTTNVYSPEDGWAYKLSATNLHLAAGTHTLTLSAPAGTAGWYLNWFSLRRM